MPIDRWRYDECMQCDGLVHLNDTGSFETVVRERNVEGSDVYVVEGRLHKDCRAPYEEENGKVECESDWDAKPAPAVAEAIAFAADAVARASHERRGEQ